MQLLSKEKIKEAFSRAAVSYDETGGFQKEIGLRLIDAVLSERSNGGRVLDVGMGTGSTTRELAKALKSRGRPLSRPSGRPQGAAPTFYGCDIAWGMVSLSKKNANGVLISQADAESLPYRTDSFDIIFSNIAYQWICDFRSAFLEVKRVLRQKGRFYFSILTEGTFKELHGTLMALFNKDYSGEFFPNARYIKLELKWHELNIIRWEELVFKRYYKNCLELIRALKKIGAGRIFGANIFNMGQRGLFFKLLDAYDRNFNEDGKVFATYKAILGCAEKI